MIGQGFKHGLALAIKYLTIPFIVGGVISGGTLLVKYGERKASKEYKMETFNNNLLKLTVKVDTLSNQIYTVSNNIEDIRDTLQEVRQEQFLIKRETNLINRALGTHIKQSPTNEQMDFFYDELLRFQGSSYLKSFPLNQEVLKEDTLKKKQIYVVSSFQ